MGALAVADRQGGPFTTEDLWLLSTVATNASVVLANSRLYEIVRRSKEEWETAFNALAEGIAVVGPTGAMLRANRALAALAGAERERAGGARSSARRCSATSEAVEELIRDAYRAAADRAAGGAAGAEPAGAPAHRRPVRRAGRPDRPRRHRIGGDPGRGRDRAAHHGGAAHPERQDGLHRPAGLRRGARAEQPAHLDRGSRRAAAGAGPPPRASPTSTCGSSTIRRSAPAGSCATC